VVNEDVRPAVLLNKLAIRDGARTQALGQLVVPTATNPRAGINRVAADAESEKSLLVMR